MKALLSKYLSDSSNTASRTELENAVHNLAKHARLFWNTSNLTHFNHNHYARNYRELFLGEDLYRLILKIESKLDIEYRLDSPPELLPTEGLSSSSTAAAPLNRPEAIPEFRAISSEGAEPMVIDEEIEEISSLPPLQSESSRPSAKEIKAVGAQLQRLSKLINKHYGSYIPDQFRKLLVDQRGRWGIDLSNPEICREDLLKPFYDFLKSPSALGNKKAAIKAVQEAFDFFGFIPSSMPIDSHGESSQNLNLYYHSGHASDDRLVHACIEELLLQNPTRTYQHTPLCEFSAREIQQSLLSLKLAEFSVISTNYHQFHAKRSIQPAVLPCFLLTQDANYIRVQVLKAHFNDRQLLEGIGEEGEDRLASTFLEQHLQITPIIRHSSKGLSTRLTWEQFKQFEQVVKESNSHSSLPKALVIQRLDPAVSIEEVIPERREEPRSIERLAGIERSKRKRQDLPDLSTSGKKRRTDEKEEEGEAHFRGTETRKTLRLDNEFHPINDNDEIFSSSRSMAKGRSTGELPIIPTAQGVGEEIEAPEIRLDNFWGALNVRSFGEMTSKVRKEKIKETVLSKLQPLDHPILGRLQKIPNPTNYLPWGRLLKRYQIHAVNQLLQYRSAGVSKLLSLPPGFGKTFAVAEYLVQLIASEPSHQIHVVAGPDCLLYQNQKELSRFAAEASVTAWQLTGRKGASKGLYMRLFERSIDFSERSSDDLSRFLRVVACFPDACKQAPNGYRWLIENEWVAAEAPQLLRKHIECIDPKNLEHFRSKIKSRCEQLHVPFTSPDTSLEQLVNFVEQELKHERDPQLDGHALYFNLYCLVGYALDLDPDRPALHDYENAYSDESLEKVRNLGITQNNSWIKRCKSAQEFSKLQSKMNLDPKRPLDHPLILITTPEGLVTQTDALKQFPIGSLVVDEASRIHTPGSKVSENVGKAIQELELHSSHERPKNSIVFVTGTPFENNLSELWNLLKMSNGEKMFPKETLDALLLVLLKGSVQYLTNPENLNTGNPEESDPDILIESLAHSLIDPDNLDGENPEENNPHILIKSFAHFMHFRTVVRQLVHHLSQNDPQARNDWKGRFPTVEYQDIPYLLSGPLLEEINGVRGPKLFSSNRKIERILIHPSLKNESMSSQQAQKWPFLQPLKNGTLEQQREWIGQSAYLTAILTNDFFINAIQNKEKIVIVAHHRGLCEAYQEAIGILFPQDHVVTSIFDGSLDEKKKDEIIDNFRGAPRDNPAVLMMMIESGGVGINLGEADRLFLTGTSWNLATDFQAICRIARANYVGTKYVHLVSFPGTYYSTHSQLIQGIKKNLEAFLWKEAPTPKDSLRLWCDVLQSETYRAYLNQAKDPDEAESKNKSVKEFLDSWAKNVPEQDLLNFLDRSRPVAPPISSAPQSRPQSSSSSASAPVTPVLLRLRLPPPLPSPQSSSSSTSAPVTPVLLRLRLPSPLPSPQSSSSSTSAPVTPVQRRPLSTLPPQTSVPRPQSSSSSTSAPVTPVQKRPLSILPPQTSVPRPLSSSSSASTSGTPVPRRPLPLPLPSEPRPLSSSSSASEPVTPAPRLPLPLPSAPRPLSSSSSASVPITPAPRRPLPLPLPSAPRLLSSSSSTSAPITPAPKRPLPLPRS